MAKRFDFRKRVDGIVETFYPKTSTDNVVRETSSGEKKLDDILDEKGAFMQFTEQNANESTGNDLLFEVLGDVIGSETMESIRGTIVSGTAPDDVRYLWIDNTTDPAVLKCYDTETESWKVVNMGSGGGSSDSNSGVELDSDIIDDIVDESGTGLIPYAMKSMVGTYDTSLGKYKLKFEEPDDTIIDGETVCTVQKVVIVRKKDSEPTSETDGTVVLIMSRSDFGQYVDTFFVDESLTPNIGDIYYYKAFPMGDGGLYNTSSESTGPLECVAPLLYGFTINPNESDPASCVSYIAENASFAPAGMNYTSDTFNYGDWGDAWFIKNIKPCMLKYDGTVDYELDPNDYTKKKADGTPSDIANTSYAGNAMVGIPKVYTKITNNADGTISVYFSDVKVDDEFHCYAHLDSAGNEMDYTYMPIYNGSDISSKLRSLSGQNVSIRTTATTEITYAKANNLNSDTIWYTEVLSDRMLINLLLVLIGKSTDSQTVFGSGNTKGYEARPYDNNGILATGTMDKKGLFWGNQDTISGVKVFGMEHWWGNIWRRIAGWVHRYATHKIKLTYGTADGSTVNGYNETGDGYIILSDVAIDVAIAEGNISKMVGSEYGLFPSETSGSTSTYYCDYFSVSYDDVCYLCVGGSSNNGLGCGPWWLDLEYPASILYEGMGASISCKPLAQKG